MHIKFFWLKLIGEKSFPETFRMKIMSDASFGKDAQCSETYVNIIFHFFSSNKVFILSF